MARAGQWLEPRVSPPSVHSWLPEPTHPQLPSPQGCSGAWERVQCGDFGGPQGGFPIGRAPHWAVLHPSPVARNAWALIPGAMLPGVSG